MKRVMLVVQIMVPEGKTWEDTKQSLVGRTCALGKQLRTADQFISGGCANTDTEFMKYSIKTTD
jgi:hypothetical protein